ncbi:methyltransferase domain-containing protein [Arthrobacter sp. STN4]|uniref:methyltransferase domain-containing protein n=1 Tax=Arthrobacter sp. STN4 TaxID=2923276 RepID=UPI00211A8466|nr:methyltransferase domain-containing protein [Arthrobacter sp. STN4]MCQ9165808.1 methyltransferase domain-containing protein [Arthrobacter sp. STN4]
MDNSALDALICPVCGLEFMDVLPGENTLACIDGHSFDIARQGYVNLLTGHGTKFTHDTAAMVAARDAFLEAGHYAPLADALAGMVRPVLAATGAAGGGAAPRPMVLDAGTGTGWYLHQLLDRLGGGVDAVALDISKFALRRAARRNPGAANLAWDLWQPLPVEAGRADVVLVVFAPRNAAEFARVLRPGGLLVVVTPRPGHLAEIAQHAGLLGIQPDKEASLAASLASHFVLESALPVSIPLHLSPADVANVALMGPAGHHIEVQELERAAAALPERTDVTAEFMLSAFRPR